MPILIKNESFNNIFLWKLCFIENNYFLCIVKLKKRRIMKYVIIGGVAGGATAAARLRRVDEMAEILLLEKGPYISYANCGLPYYIGGVIAEREKLLVQTPESFGKRFRIDVRVQNEVIAIHPKNKTVTIRNVEGKEYDESYDKLLLSPGANPVKPPLEGINSEGIFTLRNVEDTDHIKPYISDKQLKRAGLDYWHYLDISYYDGLDDFFARNAGPFYYFTTKAPQRYTDVAYPDGAYLVFGREDAGLPEALLAANQEHCIRMPMRDTCRSLNLSNSVAVGVYEVLRQWDFPELLDHGHLRDYQWK